MDKAKIFMNGKSQAVRLPKKYRFGSKEVLVQEHPMGVLLIDPKKKWNLLEKVMNEYTDDLFIEPIEDLPAEERDEIL